MARLMSMNPKNKTFIFRAYENDKQVNPVKVIYKRFPKLNENYTQIDGNFFEGVNPADMSNETEKLKLQEKFMDSFRKSFVAGVIDYKWFFDECIDCFQDFDYDTSKIITVNDYWQILPDHAAETIAAELYEYAMKKEEFSMGE